MVLINGARQAGRSTLVRALAGERAAEWRDLDLPQDRHSAQSDPVGFVSFDDLMVIDEIQRAPDLLLAIKATVDADPRLGHFLLTGSSQLLSLAGWGMAFDDHAEIVSVPDGLRMGLHTPEDALFWFTVGSHIRARLVWFNPTRPVTPKDDACSL